MYFVFCIYICLPSWICICICNDLPSCDTDCPCTTLYCVTPCDVDCHRFLSFFHRRAENLVWSSLFANLCCTYILYFYIDFCSSLHGSSLAYLHLYGSPLLRCFMCTFFRDCTQWPDYNQFVFLVTFTPLCLAFVKELWAME